jgi:hypothetical protein
VTFVGLDPKLVTWTRELAAPRTVESSDERAKKLVKGELIMARSMASIGLDAYPSKTKIGKRICCGCAATLYYVCTFTAAQRLPLTSLAAKIPTKRISIYIKRRGENF